MNKLPSELLNLIDSQLKDGKLALRSVFDYDHVNNTNPNYEFLENIEEHAYGYAKWLVNKYPIKPYIILTGLQTVCFNGDLEMVKWLCKDLSEDELLKPLHGNYNIIMNITDHVKLIKYKNMLKIFDVLMYLDNKYSIAEHIYNPSIKVLYDNYVRTRNIETRNECIDKV